MTASVLRFVRRLVRDWPLVGGTILTTASVIGAAGALLVFHLALTEPLAVPHPERLHAIRVIGASGESGSAPAPLRDALAAAALGLGTVCSRNSAGLAAVTVASASDFQTVELFGPGCPKLFGISASSGALARFDRAATTKGMPLVAFVSDRFARTRLGGNGPAVGQVIRVGTTDVEIVGVLPASFSGLKRDLQTDLLLPGLYNTTTNGSATEFVVSVDPASVGALSERLAARWPAIIAEGHDPRLTGTHPALTRVSAGFSTLGDRYGQALALLEWLALAIVIFGMVSLAAMFGLSLARRQTELQIRRALGARPSALVLSSIAPVVAAAAAGGALAAPIAKLAVSVLIREVWTSPTPLDLNVSLTPVHAGIMLAASVGLALLVVSATALAAIGLLPSGLRVEPTITGRSRARQWLLGAEIAVCVVFVAAATMFGSALLALSSAPLGFRPDSVYFARATAKPGGYAGLNESEYYPSTLEALMSAPGVQSASMSRYFTIPIVPQLSMVGAPGAETRAIEDLVSPRFFDTVGIDRKAGRDFSWRDTITTPPVGIVSESLARALFSSTDVIGRQMSIGPAGAQERVEIVGVAADAMYGRPKTPERRVVYRPSLQKPQLLRAPLYQIRAVAGATAMEAVLRDGISARGREVVAGVSQLAASVRQSMLEERLLSGIGASTAALALLLALIGLYAHLSYAVQTDVRELAIRSALGATRPHLGWQMFRRGLVVTFLGAIAGVPLLFGAARIARHLVPSLGAISVAQVLIGIAAAATVGALASLRPALRASRSDAAALMKQV